MNRVIIGLGPGRCGSASFAALLGAQNGVVASHSCPVYPHGEEGCSGIREPWARVEDLLDDPRAPKALAVVDSGPYWLHILVDGEDKPGRICVLWRPVSHIVTSMIRTDYWAKLSRLDGFAAIHTSALDYVRGYYDKACRLACQWPEIVRFVDAEKLSSYTYTDDLLAWLEIPHTSQDTHHLNRTETHG